MDKFTNSQLKTLVDIFVDTGLVGLGTVAIPVALSEGSIIIVLGGIVTCFIFWYTAVRVSGIIR